MLKTLYFNSDKVLGQINSSCFVCWVINILLKINAFIIKYYRKLKSELFENDLYSNLEKNENRMSKKRIQV